MTDEILQTDIDLARRLIDEGNGDAQIIELLGRRNIAPNRTVWLVSELRQGRPVQPDRVWRAVALQSVRSPAPQSDTRQESAVRPTPSRVRIPWFRLLIASGVGLAIVMAVLFGRQRNRQGTDQPKATAAGSNSPSASTPSADPASLLIDLSDSGLKFHGQAVGANNALQAFASALGPPSRTNRIETLNKSVYVFDDYGILVYPAVDRNPNSIVIDFEGAGGTNSAVRAFAGVFRILENSVSQSTDPNTLPILARTAATGNAGKSGIYNLKLKGIRVVLASLSRPDRLSLIEIDFEESWGDPLH